MAKGYRDQALPGILRCIDYMRDNKSKVNNTEPKIENKPPVKVEPDFDVEQFVKEKARESLRKEREDHIRKYGDQGLSQLHLINKGLFE